MDYINTLAKVKLIGMAAVVILGLLVGLAILVLTLVEKIKRRKQ
jgi:hypothetical protein